ncbi:hypothetical protein [Methylibium sp.]|uniref:hypothetical protein n=1 Tax=Methylibium sp. TaxID=2067992 RepID=UPI003D0E2A8F
MLNVQKVMKSKASTRRFAGAVILGVIIATALQAQAHGGLTFDKDVCKLAIGPYLMHFTGFQPESTASKEFCEDIPRTGRTIIVLDYIDLELRKLPVEIRIVKDTGDMSRLDAITAYHKPARMYPNGSLDVEVTFADAGKFVGIVSAGEGGRYVARFPFEVGRSRSHVYLAAAAMFIAFGGAGLYYGLRRRSGRNRRKAINVPA